ncbi:SET domain-containing protein, partial [Colletotrichum incanum]
GQEEAATVAASSASPAHFLFLDMSPSRAGTDRDTPTQRGPYNDYAIFRPVSDRVTPDNAQPEPHSHPHEQSGKRIDIIDLTINSSPLSRPQIHHDPDADRAPLAATKVEGSQAHPDFSLGSAHCLSDPSGGSTAVSSNAASILDPSPPPVSIQPSVSSVDLDDSFDAEMSRPARPEGFLKAPQQVTPPSSTRPSSHQSPKNGALSKKQTPKKDIPDVRQLVTLLKGYSADIGKAHSQLSLYALESTKPIETRLKTGVDFFANVKLVPVEEHEGTTMSIRTKQHFRGRKSDQAKTAHYMPTCVKSNKPAVPKYRFHHTEIVKNFLSPNSLLKFVPVIRDLAPEEERKYNTWLGELERMDESCGFKTLGSRDQRVNRTIKKERTATLSLFLDSWLKKLAIENCNRTTLIRHMASSNLDDAITPQQKSSLVNLHSDDNVAATPRALKAARVFTDAFDQVFYHSGPQNMGILLSDVLKLDKSVDEIVETKKTAKVGQDDSDKVDSLEHWIETHTVMGCLICYSNSCEHGDYSLENHKRNFSMDCIGIKAVILGKSQLEGCGYGLFTAEDIAQDEFVIEYTGELIVADEGVRREARRGEAFSIEKSTSYVFSLLDYEGIWVDAAIYGNLSRYINHAVENANVQPGILYVNGEFRIRFTATRNIKAGEELFFNYGENFPNLTEKMIKEKAGDGEEAAEEGAAPVKRGRGGRRRATTGTEKPATQRLTKAKIAKSVNTGARKEAPNVVVDDYEALADFDVVPGLNRKRKRVAKSDDEDEEFHPSLESEENAEARGAEKRVSTSRRRGGIRRVRSMGSIVPSDSELEGPAKTTPRGKRGQGRSSGSQLASGAQPTAKNLENLAKLGNGSPPPKKRRGRPPKNPRPPSPAVAKEPKAEHVENEIRAHPNVVRHPDTDGDTISVDLNQPPRSARGRKVTTASFNQSIEDPMDVDKNEPGIDATPTRSRERRRAREITFTARGPSRTGRTTRRLTIETDAVTESDEEPLTLTPASTRKRMQKRVLAPLENNDSESSYRMQGGGTESDDDDEPISSLSRSSRKKKLPARFRLSSDEEP